MLKHARGLAGLAIAAGLLLGGGTASAANIIQFQVVGDGSVKPGDDVQIELTFDFDQSTVGGGLDLLFDRNDFGFKSFVFSATLGDDVGFRTQPEDGSEDEDLAIGFGNFAELVGVKTVGVLTLVSKQNMILSSTPGGTQALGARDSQGPAGKFIGFDGPNIIDLPVEYQGLYTTVIPEPGTMLLLGAGLVGLAASRRQKH